MRREFWISQRHSSIPLSMQNTPLNRYDRATVILDVLEIYILTSPGNCDHLGGQRRPSTIGDNKEATFIHYLDTNLYLVRAF